MVEILLAVVLTACASLVIGMLAFGPRILEWIEGTPQQARQRVGRAGEA